MAGKKGMKGGGGARPNSGPAKGTKYKTADKLDISDDLKEEIQNDAKALMDEFGESLNRAILRLCYIEDTPGTVKASIWNTYLATMTVKKTEQDVKVNKNFGPAIGLPPMEEDPALKVVKGGK